MILYIYIFVYIRMEAVSLDQIKREKRLEHFKGRFDPVLTDQLVYLSENSKLQESFICDVMVHMLEYTCQDLQDHNERLTSIDIKRITCYYTLEVIKEVLGVNISELKLDTMTMLYYIATLMTNTLNNKYCINYIAYVTSEGDKVFNDTASIAQSISSNKTTEPRIETYQPTSITTPVATEKTKNRLSKLMRKRK